MIRFGKIREGFYRATLAAAKCCPCCSSRWVETFSEPTQEELDRRDSDEVMSMAEERLRRRSVSLRSASLPTLPELQQPLCRRSGTSE